MPTQSSGPISFADLRNFLGTGAPTSFNQFYRGGTYVPNIVPNDHVPTAGEINIQEMYSTWVLKTLTFTINVGSYASSGLPGKKGTLYGYGLAVKGGTFGSISQNTFLTPNGPVTIEGLYFSTSNHAWNLQLSGASAPVDDDTSFGSMTVTGYDVNGVRSAATSTQTTGTARKWTWVVTSTSHPTSGTIDCTINYYG
jgi:hypothetical protein